MKGIKDRRISKAVITVKWERKGKRCKENLRRRLIDCVMVDITKYDLSDDIQDRSR